MCISFTLKHPLLIMFADFTDDLPKSYRNLSVNYADKNLDLNSNNCSVCCVE